MAATELVITVGALVMVAALLLVAMVSVGIRREERLFRERRRLLQEQGDWPGPGVPNQFFTTEAPGWASRVARSVTGLWIRRSKSAEPQPVPWYERRS